MDNVSFCPQRKLVQSDWSTVLTSPFEVQTTKFELQTAKYGDPVIFSPTEDEAEDAEEANPHEDGDGDDQNGIHEGGGRCTFLLFTCSNICFASTRSYLLDVKRIDDLLNTQCSG